MKKLLAHIAVQTVLLLMMLYAADYLRAYQEQDKHPLVALLVLAYLGIAVLTFTLMDRRK